MFVLYLFCFLIYYSYPYPYTQLFKLVGLTIFPGFPCTRPIRPPGHSVYSTIPLTWWISLPDHSVYPTLPSTQLICLSNHSVYPLILSMRLFCLPGHSVYPTIWSTEAPITPPSRPTQTLSLDYLTSETGFYFPGDCSAYTGNAATRFILKLSFSVWLECCFFVDFFQRSIGKGILAILANAPKRRCIDWSIQVELLMRVLKWCDRSLFQRTVLTLRIFKYARGASPSWRHLNQWRQHHGVISAYYGCMRNANFRNLWGHD